MDGGIRENLREAPGALSLIDAEVQNWTVETRDSRPLRPDHGELVELEHGAGHRGINEVVCADCRPPIPFGQVRDPTMVLSKETVELLLSAGRVQLLHRPGRELAACGPNNLADNPLDSAPAAFLYCHDLVPTAPLRFLRDSEWESMVSHPVER